jgi:hypothetical protein
MSTFPLHFGILVLRILNCICCKLNVTLAIMKLSLQLHTMCGKISQNAPSVEIRSSLGLFNEEEKYYGICKNLRLLFLKLKDHRGTI